VRLLRPYQVNRAAREKTGNPRVKFLHWRPAYHDKKTVAGRESMEHTGLDDGLEVTDEVFESPHSIVPTRREPPCTIKAVLAATLATG
jgi:ornithine carbamoyltransferase